MDQNRRLLENLRKVNPVKLSICQGIVIGTDGAECTCRIGSMEISGIRLRASLTDRERQMLVVPKTGSAVVLGSLSGDLSNLVVLQVDEAESVTFNGGQLGGLVNIGQLTDRINELVEAFNGHTHSIPVGAVSVTGTSGPSVNQAPITVPAVSSKASRFHRDDYEDSNINH